MSPISEREFDNANLSANPTFKGGYTYDNDPTPCENFNMSLNLTVGPNSPLHSRNHPRVNYTTNKSAVEAMRQIVYQYDLAHSRNKDPDALLDYLTDKIPTEPNRHAVQQFNVQRITSRKPVPRVVIETAQYNLTEKPTHSSVYIHLGQKGVKVTGRTVEFCVQGDNGLTTTTDQASSVIDNRLVLDKDISTNPFTDPITGNVYAVSAPDSSRKPVKSESPSFVLA